jgi:serine/threonine protein kinase
VPGISHPQPNELGGYTIVRTLAPDLTWLATAPGRRQVVLKVLDEDCLWKGQLHPNIKDRLGRVRELAHPGVANLYGVERDGQRVYAVWEYVPGQTLEDFAESAACDDRTLITLAREVMLALEMLHARGIVHGAVTASNVIIHPSAQNVTLTHVSPLLYSEPQEDVCAGIRMLQQLGRSSLSQLVEDPSLADRSPRQLASLLNALTDAKDPTASDTADDSDLKETTRIRRRALVGAAATAGLAIALFAGLRIYASRTTPAAPVPPEATPAALQPSPRTDSKQP